MKTLTIRGLPDEVHGALKDRARLNRRSLNQEVIAELAEGRIEGEAVVERRRLAHERMERALANVDTLRTKMPRFMSADEIDEAIKEGRR